MEETPKIPVDVILKHLAEGADRAHDRAAKASDILLGPLETDIATTPYEIIYQDDRVKLKHYLPVREPSEEIRTPCSWSMRSSTAKPCSICNPSAAW